MSSRNLVLGEEPPLTPAEQADAALPGSVNPADDGIEAAWLAEVERRLAEYEAGQGSSRPWEDVRRDLHARLHAARR